MTVLSDRDLKERLPEIIDPYDEECVQPSSYDVKLGDSFRVFHNYTIGAVDLSDPPANLTTGIEIHDEGLIIHPGEFVLGVTKEVVTVPHDLTSRIEGKSSVGRLGLIVHATAGWIDPGFHGAVTLEMTNLLRVPIKVKPGLDIAQLTFQQLSSPAENPYDGRYQGDTKASPSRYGKDKK